MVIPSKETMLSLQIIVAMIAYVAGNAKFSEILFQGLYQVQ